jgi:di/tricarboxylate transporter
MPAFAALANLCRKLQLSLLSITGLARVWKAATRRTHVEGTILLTGWMEAVWQVLTGTPFSLLSAKLAAEYLGDRSITWGSWLTASCVPVVTLLVLTPALTYWLFPPPPEISIAGASAQ